MGIKINIVTGKSIMKFYKNLKIFFSICLVFGMASPATADEISGIWVANIDQSRIEMTFKVDGTTLTGKVDNSSSGSVEIKDGNIDGDNISFHVMRKLSGFGDSEFKIVWFGEIIGDEILFKREFAGTSKGVIAKRKTGTQNNISKQGEVKSEAASYENLSGNWILSNKKEQILKLLVEGSSITGTVDVNNMGPAEITEGKIEGDKLFFHVIRQINLNEFDATWEGTVVGDEIHFNIRLNGSNLNFIARREEPKTEPETKELVAQDNTVIYDYLSGKWTASFAQGLILMDFKVDGSTLTGTVGPKDMSRNDILEGKIENDMISFHVMPQMMNRRVKTVWDGTIVGDKIRFTVQFPTNTFNFIAKKAEVDEKGTIKEEVQLPPTVDPSGTWILNEDGKEYVMSFKSVGMSLTGVIRISPPGRTLIIPDAKISGDTISFSLMKRIGPNQFRIHWVGKIVGEEIHFEGVPFNKFERVIANKIKSNQSQGDEDKVTIKLLRDEEIKNSKISEKYKELRKKDSEYDAAMGFFDKYQYHLALPLLEQIYTRLPKEAVLLHRLGVCLIMQSIYPPESQERKAMRAHARGLLEKSKKQGMENELLEYYLEVIPEDGGDDDGFSKHKEVDESLIQAEKIFALRDFQTSLLLYARTMEIDPTNYKAVLYVGDSYFANGQYKDAIEWFEQATKVNPDKETAWRFWGDCLIRLDKKNEGRSKFIDALIAEPYNPLSWNGVRNFINSNKLELKTPDIQRPQRLEASGELLVAEKNIGDSDGTEAWSYYNDVAREWRSNKFHEKFPDEKEYRHTLDEEKEALEQVAEKVNEDIKKGLLKSNDLNPGILLLLELHASGLLEPYILFRLADREIIKEYPTYRKSNRDKLKQYLDRFEVPKTGDQKVL